MNKDYEVYYRFLEALRQSGIVNMYGAVPYLQAEFGLDQKNAIKILASWMNNYAEISEKLYSA